MGASAVGPSVRAGQSVSAVCLPLQSIAAGLSNGLPSGRVRSQNMTGPSTKADGYITVSLNRRSSEIQGTALGKSLRAWTYIYMSMPAGVAQSRHAFVVGTVSKWGR